MAVTADGDFDYQALEGRLRSATEGPELQSAIVNAPFDFPAAAAFIFLGIIVLLVVNEEDGTIDRVALSDTSHADATKQVSVKPFNSIRVPVDAPHNLIARVIRDNKPEGTSDWVELFTPELTAEQARINQANGGIGYSAVYPLTVPGRLKGAMIFSYYQYPEGIADAQRIFMEQYVGLVTQRLRG